MTSPKPRKTRKNGKSRTNRKGGNAILQSALIPLSLLALNQLYSRKSLRNLRRKYRGTRKGNIRKTARKAYKKHRGGTRH